MNPTASSPDVVTIPADLLADFEAAAQRPLRQRMRYAFIHTYKPVLDDADFRASDPTAIGRLELVEFPHPARSLT